MNIKGIFKILKQNISLLSMVAKGKNNINIPDQSYIEGLIIIKIPFLGFIYHEISLFTK